MVDQLQVKPVREVFVAREAEIGEGERKVIQMNWVTEQRFVDREAKRHRWSALMKGLRFS